jgi:hypothetical protein
MIIICIHKADVHKNNVPKFLPQLSPPLIENICNDKDDADDELMYETSSFDQANLDRHY